MFPLQNSQNKERNDYTGLSRMLGQTLYISKLSSSFQRYSKAAMRFEKKSKLTFELNLLGMSSSDEEIVINRSGKRSSRNVPKNSKREETLAKIREAKAGGLKYKPEIEVKDVYETVDEEEYQRIINEKQRTAFVVDDEGDGYYDDEDDDFLDEYDDAGDEKKATKNNKSKNDKIVKGSIKNYFSAATKEKVKDDKAVKLDDDEVLKDLLKELDCGEETVEEVVIEQPSRNPFKRHLESPVENEKPVKSARISSTPVIGDSTTLRKVSVVKEEFSTPVRPTSANVNKSSTKDTVMKDDFPLETEDILADDFDVSIDKTAFEEEKIKHMKSIEVSAPLKLEQTTESLPDQNYDLMEEDDFESNDGIQLSEDFNGSVGLNEPEKDDSNSVVMHLVDAFEDPIKHPSTVFLFGRVQKSVNYNKSVCVKLHSIERQVFFIPRTKRIVNQNVTDVQVKIEDVHEEVKNILLRDYNILTFKSRVTKKKLAFEDEEWNNKEVDCLEVRYEAKFPCLPKTLSGETFFKICNTTSSALERVLLECKIMGPSVIKIENVVPADSKISYCELEYLCNMEKMNNIKNLEGFKGPPTVTKLVSFNLVTELNQKNENRIIMINGVYDLRSCNVDKTLASWSNLNKFCYMTTPSKTSYPYDWKDKCSRKGIKNADFFKTESEVIIKFLEFLERHDFDLYIGHDFTEQLSKLVSRLDKLKIPQWSRISRLKRTIDIHKVGFSKTAQWELTGGRLVADSRTAAMELLKAKSYDLDDLVEQLFGKKNTEDLFNGSIKEHYGNGTKLACFIERQILDSWYSVNIISKLDAIPLFAQITRTVGGVFSRTLLGGRSERNEYLLLHAFYDRNYIVPDKHTKVSSRAINNENVSSSKKAAFSGGMVLEPLKGLYDTYIILLDFNSLYPSIIQEYNICFTTIANCTKEPNNEDDLPAAPGSKKELGVLPIEIRKLVESRRSVKRQLKNQKLGSLERKKLEIKQMALKLTANSMYGCLGFNASRFCAKSLAALVTKKGREILTNTKNLVERSNYKVIYGDTDSIMINSNSHSLQQAKDIAETVKNMVNKCYNSLEIDLDGVYKKLLLLKKKKYAGLSVNPNNEKEEQFELKGLDIVRRDWSVVAKETGSTVVDLIFSKDRDELGFEIHSMLGSLKNKLINNEIPLEKFEIFKQLTKNPTEYNDVKSQPHVSVALRLNNAGKNHYKTGDVIKYIICDDGTGNSATQRAYHKSEIERNPTLKVDVDYYLKQQILPVVTRLCEPIEETSQIQIAEALGLDTTGLRRKLYENDNQIDSNDVDATFEQDFEACKSLVFECPNPECMDNIEIRSPILTFGNICKLALDRCNKCECPFNENKGYITNCLTEQLRNQIKEYCASSYVCDDETCAYQSRRPPIKMSRLGPLCLKCENGIMKKKYTIRKLYDQQCFFRNIFDLEHAMSKECMNLEVKKQIESNANFSECKELYSSLFNIVNKYLNMNTFNIVDLSFIFAPSFS
uniref:DNA polymerase n=1 Tax=Strongyloides venezuelensis TaxID=75913 RepID=A0A0K0FW10_STRVS